MDDLAADLLRNERKAERMLAVLFDLIGDIRLILREFVTESAADRDDAVMIPDHFDPAEDDHAAKDQRPAVFFPDTGITDAERCFRIAQHRIDLVAGPAAVKVDLSVLFAVVVVQRHSVGIAVIPEHGEDTGGSAFRMLMHSSCEICCFFLTSSRNIL